MKHIQPKNQDLLVKSCPFCGSTTIEISNTHTCCYSVVCESCGAEVTGPSLHKNWKSVARQVADHLRAIRIAVAKWNLRTVGPLVEMGVKPAHLECHIHHGTGKSFVDLGGEFGREKSDD